MPDKLPFVDLTTAGASVDPQTLLNDPRYVPQPDMPEGEPDYHELVFMVLNLNIMVLRQSQEIAALKGILRTTHVELVQGDQALHKRLVYVETKVGELIDYANSGDSSFCPSRD